MMDPTELYRDFGFALLDSPEFKEDSVREELVLPLLRLLGYSASGPAKIQRAKKLKHAFVRVGAKERPLLTYPDYLLSVEGKRAFVLDAKRPDEDVHYGKNVEQAYFYAIHPEVRVNYFALCNGRDLTVFHVSEEGVLLSVSLQEIAPHWDRIKQLLSPSSFSEKPVHRVLISPKREGIDYLGLQPPSEIPAFSRQTAKRHFGVHGYFTKQPWYIVQAHIRSLTQVGDLVLDPFGGSGVTLIEAMMLGRRAIHVDLNPLSAFIVSTLIEPVNHQVLLREFERISRKFTDHKPVTGEQVKAALSRYPHPKGLTLPKNSDVDMIEQLFSPRQLAQLAYLKHLIFRTPNPPVRRTLLLMFSGFSTR